MLDNEVRAFSSRTEEAKRVGVRLRASMAFRVLLELREVIIRAKMFKESVNCQSKLQGKHSRKQISLSSSLKRHVNFVR